VVGYKIIRIFVVFIVEKNIFHYLFIACESAKNYVLNVYFMFSGNNLGGCYLVLYWILFLKLYV
jgi:hypothetical protein